MRDGFYNWDDDDEPRRVAKEVVMQPGQFIADPREMGGVLVQSKPVDNAKCSICDKKLALEIFVFDAGKLRRFIRCEGCKKYLFEMEKKRKKPF